MCLRARGRGYPIDTPSLCPQIVGSATTSEHHHPQPSRFRAPWGRHRSSLTALRKAIDSVAPLFDFDLSALSTWWIAVLVLAGFFAGLVDAIAGGGGLLTLPALLTAGLPPHIALGTNKGQAIFGAVSSFVSFWIRGRVDRSRVALGLSFGFAGALAGAALLFMLSPERLRPIMLVLLVVAAAIVALRRTTQASKPLATRPRLALAVFALAVGVYDGFFGPGTGSILIVGNALLFGDGLTRASGNAKVINLASNIAAALLFSLRGTILWRLAVPMAAANALGAFVGAHLAVRRGDGFVRKVVLLVVLVVVVKLAIDLLAN